MYGVRSSKPCNPFQEYTFSSELKWTRKFWVVVTWFRKEVTCMIVSQIILFESTIMTVVWMHSPLLRTPLIIILEQSVKRSWNLIGDLPKSDKIYWKNLARKGTREISKPERSALHMCCHSKSNTANHCQEKPKLQSPTTLGRNLLSYLLNITVG